MIGILQIVLSFLMRKTVFIGINLESPDFNLGIIWFTQLPQTWKYTGNRRA